MKNGEVMVSVWENNREDGEDSASQVKSEENLQWTEQIVKHVNVDYSFIVCFLGRDSGDEERRSGLR